jgi:membrane dipeptidase
MQWIDGHLDLAYLALRGADLRREIPDHRTGCVSLPALRQANIEVCFATIYTEPGVADATQLHGYPSSDHVEAAEAAGLRQVEVYERWEAQGEVAIVRRRADLDRAGPSPKLVLLMEGADPIRSPDHVERWFSRGVRIVGLTWAAGTRYAGGNSAPLKTGALTGLGIDLIAALDGAGVIHDASHLSDAAFDGLIAHARGPIIASHSNCRDLLEPKQRHLRDDQIREIGRRGGVVGLNLYSPFLAVNRRATVADCVAHLDHVAETMGHRRGVALGSDMDGGFAPGDLPDGLDHPRRLPALADALRSAGWSQDQVEGLAGRNWRWLLESAWGRS